MGNNVIITIGRQFGSGGREVGRILAQQLGIEFYDKELLGRTAKESGISKELFVRADEQPTNSFLYSLSLGAAGMGAGFMASPDYLTNDKLFGFQSETIRKIAAEHSCVIIGRCADYVLRENPNLISVFVHADMEHRVARILERQKISAEEARQLIRKNDRRRANYYNYFTDRNWGGADNYHMSIDSGRVGVAGAVEMIRHLMDTVK